MKLACHCQESLANTRKQILHEGGDHHCEVFIANLEPMLLSSRIVLIVGAFVVLEARAVRYWQVSTRPAGILRNMCIQEIEGPGRLERSRRFHARERRNQQTGEIGEV